MGYFTFQDILPPMFIGVVWTRLNEEKSGQDGAFTMMLEWYDTTESKVLRRNNYSFE